MQLKAFTDEKKCHMKSVRMTPTVFSYVEKHQGDGFNDKFQNLIIFCMKALPDLEKKIKEREKYLSELNATISKNQNISNNLRSISYYIDNALNAAKNMKL
ncbi:hypothetical protein Psfp_03419 [Pelotomaculum sp. FP]|nr:hypothetical protein Psfp_03419 [Pelotomaculum sp. FP]